MTGTKEQDEMHILAINDTLTTLLHETFTLIGNHTA